MLNRSMVLILILTATAFALSATKTEAKVITQDVDYSQGGVALQGYLAYDDSLAGVRPGVLIAHQWRGIQDYERGRARQLAELGYVAFCADVYGKGVRPADAAAAGAEAGKYRNNRPLLRARMQAGLHELTNMKLVDGRRVAAIGYCFGGGAVLELARSGAEIAGVVTFHGDVSNPTPADAAKIRCKVLVLHGAADPAVTLAAVEAFMKEMSATQVDWQVVLYSGAVHAFTDPAAGNDPSKGIAYNAEADKRSWQAMRDFFDELFAPAKAGSAVSSK